MDNTKKITTIVIDNPGKEDYRVAKNFAEEHWGTDKLDEEEVNMCFFDIPSKIVEAIINNVLVGLAYLHYREISFGGKMLMLSGVGGVVTHKDFRRMGVATEVVKRAVEVMKEDKIDFSMLCTDIKNIGKLYGGVGFVPLQRPYYFIDRNGTKRDDKDGMIRAICNKEIFNEIMRTDNELNVGVSDF